ncbi:MAG: polysaccharide deacetylase family protein [Nitrospirae bacterium]|nr:polysaccharide deacetylase family protein [Nitrospirota bacterium]
MLNALTVDLEDWYHICGVERHPDMSQWDAYESRIVRNTDNILRLLKTYNTRATFFVLGYIAYKEPTLIKAIKAEGHEIATHGFCHRRIFEMTEREFEEDVRKSVDIISSITSEKVLGFRAPEWSIRKETSWALGILRKLGILYDSSMVPLTRMGSRDFPLYPCKYKTEHGDIWEFPLTTTGLFWENLPFSGGLPLRLAPYFYIVSKVKRINRQGFPAIVYIHPWEFDREQPRIDLPLSRRFMHYFNIKVAPQKIEGLLKHLPFAPVKDVLGLG